MNRRDLLYSVAALVATGRGFAASALAESGMSQSDEAAVAQRIRLGAHTNAWPVDPSQFDTLLAALDDVRATGYSGFETGFANFLSQSKSLPHARRQIEATGLTFLGVHIFLSEYDPVTNVAPQALYERVAQTGAALGAQRLILSGGPAVTPKEVRSKAEALNRAGEFARKLGLEVAYHNHWPEFKYNGKEIEALYAATDPAMVWFLLDAGHAYRSGIDLPDFVRRHSQRLTAIHFRDYRDHVQVPLGEGTLPLEKIAAVLKEGHWSGWAINEEEREDGSKQGLAVIRPAFEALKGAFSA